MKKVSVGRMLFLMALYGVVANLVHPISPTIYTNLHFHDYMFGVAFAAMSVTNFAFSPFWGKILDRYGAGMIMGIAFLGYAFSQFLFGVATTELGITIARFLAGIFIANISVGQILYIMKYSPEGKSAQNLMYNATINAVLAPVGYLIGGFMGNWSIFWTCMTQVIGLIVIAILFFLILDDEESGVVFTKEELIRDSNPFKSFTAMKPYLNGLVWVFLLICVFAKFGSTCYEQSFNYLIKAEFGFPSSYNGILKAFVGIIVLVTNLTICNYLVNKTNAQKSLIYVMVILFALSMGIIVTKEFVPFIVINVVFFGLNSIYLPLLQAVLTRLSTPESKGIFAGIYNAMISIGMVLGSLIAGFAYEISSALPFILTAICFGTCVVLGAMNYRQGLQKKLW